MSLVWRVLGRTTPLPVAGKTRLIRKKRPAYRHWRRTMRRVTYDNRFAPLLAVDPYNDFISEGGKIWPRIKAVAGANDCVPHMQQVLNAARQAKLRVFYAMHHRY